MGVSSGIAPSWTSSVILHFLYLDNSVIHGPGRSDEQHVCELSLIKMFIYGMHCHCLSWWIQQTFKITSEVTTELVLFILFKIPRNSNPRVFTICRKIAIIFVMEVFTWHCMPVHRELKIGKITNATKKRVTFGYAVHSWERLSIN